MNLLIIDDDEKIVELYAKLATPYFKHVFKASTFASTEKILKLHEMDVIISDINLAEGLGSDLLISNRKWIGNAKLYFISCSENLPDHVAEVKKFGMNVVGCDTKPLNVKMLVSIFKSCATI